MSTTTLRLARQALLPWTEVQLRQRWLDVKKVPPWFSNEANENAALALRRAIKSL